MNHRIVSVVQITLKILRVTAPVISVEVNGIAIECPLGEHSRRGDDQRDEHLTGGEPGREVVSGAVRIKPVPVMDHDHFQALHDREHEHQQECDPAAIAGPGSPWASL